MKIAIVGAGIVGSTAAYYLSKEKDAEVTVFDHGLGQATKQEASCRREPGPFPIAILSRIG